MFTWSASFVRQVKWSAYLEDNTLHLTNLTQLAFDKRKQCPSSTMAPILEPDIRCQIIRCVLLQCVVACQKTVGGRVGGGCEWHVSRRGWHLSGWLLSSLRSCLGKVMYKQQMAHNERLNASSRIRFACYACNEQWKAGCWFSCDLSGQSPNWKLKESCFFFQAVAVYTSRESQVRSIFEHPRSGVGAPGILGLLRLCDAKFGNCEILEPEPIPRTHGVFGNTFSNLTSYRTSLPCFFFLVLMSREKLICFWNWANHSHTWNKVGFSQLNDKNKIKNVNFLLSTFLPFVHG